VVVDTIDSTNDEALRQLAAGRPTPFAVRRAAADEGPRTFWAHVAQ
jgi:hypothetical protein